MYITISKTAAELGKNAVAFAAQKLREAIAANGEARLVLSTGASQLTTIEPLIEEDVDWSKVTMFHLDEYVGLPETHIASFRKYLKERFISKISLAGAHLVDGDAASIPALTAALRERPVDVGLIGIGENAHIAFNDPPANFDTTEAYIVVELDEACKRQQVGEGWFAGLEDVPKQAISMTTYQIMQCRTIISCVPFAVKANAVRDTLQSPLTNKVPATLLKTHRDWHLYIDAESAGKIEKNKIDTLGFDGGFAIREA